MFDGLVFPLGSLIENIFMNHFKNIHFERLVNQVVKLFVDVTCVI